MVSVYYVWLTFSPLLIFRFILMHQAPKDVELFFKPVVHLSLAWQMVNCKVSWQNS